MFEREKTENPRRNTLPFGRPQSLTDAEDSLSAFFGVNPEEVRTVFQKFFADVPADGRVAFYENLEGVQRPDQFPSRPFDIVGYDKSGKALLRVIVSFPLQKGEFCTVMRTTNVRFFEISRSHMTYVMQVREKFDRLFRAGA